MKIEVTGQNLTIDNVWDVAYKKASPKLSDSSRKQVSESRKYIEKFLESKETVYGVNTGFGALSSVSISPHQIIDLQKNLVRSHCVGVGEIFSEAEVRAILLLRANALARGHSGVRVEVIEKILEFLEKN